MRHQIVAHATRLPSRCNVNPAALADAKPGCARHASSEPLQRLHRQTVGTPEVATHFASENKIARRQPHVDCSVFDVNPDSNTVASDLRHGMRHRRSRGRWLVARVRKTRNGPAAQMWLAFIRALNRNSAATRLWRRGVAFKRPPPFRTLARQRPLVRLGREHARQCRRSPAHF